MTKSVSVLALASALVFAMLGGRTDTADSAPNPDNPVAAAPVVSHGQASASVLAAASADASASSAAANAGIGADDVEAKAGAV